MNKPISKGVFQFTQALQIELNQLPGIKLPKTTEASSVLTLQQVVTDDELHKAISKLFHNGHHAQAVEQAFKFLNTLVKKTSGRGDLDGAKLMREVFSANKPILYLNGFSNSSEKDEQGGYMDIFAGVMTGIRNPRAHEHDWEDTEERALQLLALANHLVLRVRNSEKTP